MIRCSANAVSAVAVGSLAPLNAYLLALLAAAAASRTSERREQARGELRFAVLVPARDEETALPATLASLERLDYPRDRIETLVVADNCSDRTADVARAAGAMVWERSGDADVGKGAALTWGLRRMLAERPQVDAVVLIDADCTVAPNLVTAIEARLRAGSRAVQVPYGVANPDASWVAALRFASLALVNIVRPLGKARLGLSAGLFGTGMALRCDLLRLHPWTATSLVEDQEYHLRLVAAGERVAFAQETWVRSPMPTSLRRARSQQLRWDAGRGELFRRHAPGLLSAGLRRRDPGRINAALEQLVPPQSLLLAANAGAAVLARAASPRVRRLAGANLGAQAGFVVGGLMLADAPASVWRALALAPALAAWRLVLVARLLMGRAPTSWVRTEREAAPPVNAWPPAEDQTV